MAKSIDNSIRDFKKFQSDRILSLLRDCNIYTTEESDAIVHALLDISESFEKIYTQIIPDIIENERNPLDQLKDKIWDLREEFRHIDYHIHDANLTDL